MHASSWIGWDVLSLGRMENSQQCVAVVRLYNVTRAEMGNKVEVALNSHWISAKSN